MCKQKLANLPHIDKINPFLKNSDHIDVKAVDGKVTLREFVASMISYQPWWLVVLYHLRTAVAHALKLEKHRDLKGPIQINPEDISFTPEKNVHFFIVTLSKEGQYLILETPEDKHLHAYLAISVENLNNDINRFHVITVVFYKHWTGPVYFNLIRPFHHLVVRQMMRAGVRI